MMGVSVSVSVSEGIPGAGVSFAVKRLLPHRISQWETVEVISFTFRLQS